MNVEWAAAAVRARTMTHRRLGRDAARTLAAGPSLEAALAALARTDYGARVHAGQDVDAAQHGITETLVWNVRVLAGWVPRRGVAMLRDLMAPVEIANTERHLERLSGDDPPPPVSLGALGIAWPRLAATTSAGEVRDTLATSLWGDPGGETARDIGLAMRMSLADRILVSVPTARAWVTGAAALLLARIVLLEDGTLDGTARMNAVRALGSAAVRATTLPRLAAALPGEARWVLADITTKEQLWQAEARWWGRLDTEAAALLRRSNVGPEPVIGAVAVLAADAWRVRAALAVAARGGIGLETFDAVA